MTLLLEQDELCVCDFVGALGKTQLRQALERWFAQKTADGPAGERATASCC
jgi:hypothetical protein